MKVDMPLNKIFCCHLPRLIIVFGVDINPMYYYVATQICCRPMSIVIELTQIICSWLWKDQSKIGMRVFAVLKSHMTSNSGFEQTDPIKVFKMAANQIGLNRGLSSKFCWLRSANCEIFESICSENCFSQKKMLTDGWNRIQD